MYRLFKRQRRRLILFAAFAALPVAALIGLAALPAWGVWGALCAGALSGVCMISLPLFALRFAPHYRALCEGAILGVIVGIALQLATRPLADIPMLGPWQVFVGLGLLILFFAFDLPNRLLPARTYRGRQTFRTPQSTYTLWANHLPDPGLLDRHWSDALHELVMDRRNPAVRIATYRTHAGLMRQRQCMTEETTYTSFAYDFTQLLADGSDGPTGHYALTIRDLGRHRDVTISQQVNGLPFMAWLSTWLDDIVGDECDHHAARGNGSLDRSVTGQSLRLAPHRLVGPSLPKELAR